MRTIVILCGRYLPGFKDGGPLRTVVNICTCLGEEYRIRVITNDRDHGDTKPYPNIVYNSPNQVGNAEVWYLKPGGFTYGTIKNLTRDADVVYCCGVYDDYAYKSMILKRLGKIKKPLVVASMGVFSEGAIKIKIFKKKIFLCVCKFLGLFKKVVWSTTSELEKADVKKNIGDKAICYIAEDLPRKVPKMLNDKKYETPRGVFISRICEMKNLLHAIEILKGVNCPLKFDVYGVIEDNIYWEKCKKEIEKLPSNVICEYKGIADSEKVIEIFSNYDFFLFPTKGENYGHVIFEALAGGCLPIISDQTPWLNLEEHNAGFVFGLEDKESFIKCIEELCASTKELLLKKKEAAAQYALNKYNQSVDNTGYRTIFEL